MNLPYLWHSDMVLNQFEDKLVNQTRKGPTMSKALINELEIRLADLKAKLAEEKASLNPVPLYIDDLNLTIGYVERQLQAVQSATVSTAIM